jgi:hypothetical protein
VAEEPPVALDVAGGGVGERPDRPAAEEQRQHRAHPVDRHRLAELVAGRLEERLLDRRRCGLEALVRPGSASRPSVTTPAVMASGLPDSVPAW